MSDFHAGYFLRRTDVGIEEPVFETFFTYLKHNGETLSFAREEASPKLLLRVDRRSPVALVGVAVGRHDHFMFYDEHKDLGARLAMVLDCEVWAYCVGTYDGSEAFKAFDAAGRATLEQIFQEDDYDELKNRATEMLRSEDVLTGTSADDDQICDRIEQLKPLGYLAGSLECHPDVLRSELTFLSEVTVCHSLGEQFAPLLAEAVASLPERPAGSWGMLEVVTDHSDDFEPEAVAPAPRPPRVATTPQDKMAERLRSWRMSPGTTGWSLLKRGDVDSWRVMARQLAEPVPPDAGRMCDIVEVATNAALSLPADEAFEVLGEFFQAGVDPLSSSLHTTIWTTIVRRLEGKGYVENFLHGRRMSSVVQVDARWIELLGGIDKNSDIYPTPAHLLNLITPLMNR